MKKEKFLRKRSVEKIKGSGRDSLFFAPMGSIINDFSIYFKKSLFASLRHLQSLNQLVITPTIQKHVQLIVIKNNLPDLIIKNL